MKSRKPYILGNHVFRTGASILARINSTENKDGNLYNAFREWRGKIWTMESYFHSQIQRKRSENHTQLVQIRTSSRIYMRLLHAKEYEPKEDKKICSLGLGKEWKDQLRKSLKHATKWGKKNLKPSRILEPSKFRGRKKSTSYVHD
jgi:hypothetical protein